MSTYVESAVSDGGALSVGAMAMVWVMAMACVMAMVWVMEMASVMRMARILGPNSYQKISKCERLTLGVTEPYMSNMQKKMMTPEIQGHRPKRLMVLSGAMAQLTR